MKIIELELNHYRGFRLRQITHFVYKPNLKTQVILGTNGSGKSSLLQELSPLPAVASDFAKGGSKIITIDHMGRHFVLKSLFESTGTNYLFEVDGVEENPGRTITVYKELVKKYFNYTSEIHALMTGLTKFHSMQVNDRRNWLTRISDNDFTYAIKYHQRLKEKIRDLQGALKLSQTRLTHETEKCLTEEKAIEIREQVSELTHLLNVLLDHRKPKLPDPSSYRTEVDNIEISLQADLEAMEKLLDEIDGVGCLLTLDELQSRSIALQTTLGTLQNEMTARCSVIEKLQSNLIILNTASSSSSEDIKRTLADLDIEETELVERLKYPIQFRQPFAAENAFASCIGYLTHILSKLAELPRLDYDYAELQVQRDKVPVLKSNLGTIKAYLAECFEKKRHLEIHRDKDAVECPKCNHKWNLNYSLHEYEKACRLYDQTLETETRLTLALNEAEKTISEQETFHTWISNYHNLVKDSSILKPLWSYIDGTEFLTKSPDSIISMLNGFGMDLKIHVQLEQVRMRLKEQQELMTMIENSKSIDRTKIESSMDEENYLLLMAQSKSKQTFMELEENKKSIQRLKMLDEYTQAAYDSIMTRDDALRLLIQDDCVSTLDELIRSTKLTLSQYERTLSQVDLQKGIVKSIAAQIKESEEDLRLLKMAQKALSPVEGLIARGQTGFINQFLEKVNAFIAKFWLYPLELLPIKPDEDDSLELDYKFMVRVNLDDSHTSPDISKTSVGMQEIIDLAFVAVSMKYLGLENYPIYLDEFAKAFDPAHRQLAYQTIDHLIESADYTQVYLVSHYQDGYSNLTASEVLVLCDSNVQMPAHLAYNNHVVMT